MVYWPQSPSVPKENSKQVLRSQHAVTTVSEQCKSHLTSREHWMCVGQQACLFFGIRTEKENVQTTTVTLEAPIKRRKNSKQKRGNSIASLADKSLQSSASFGKVVTTNTTTNQRNSTGPKTSSAV